MIPVLIFIVAATPIIILQIGLMLGAPWGKLAMGGQFGDVFPLKLRIGAGIQLLIILMTLIIVLTRAQVILFNFFSFSKIAIWFVVVLYFISAILNSITSSKPERMLGAPTSIMLFLSSLILALN